MPSATDLITSGRVDVEVATIGRDHGRISHANVASGVPFGHPRSHRIMIDGLHRTETCQRSGISADAAAGIDDGRHSETPESIRFPVGDGFRGRLLDSGHVAPEIIDRFEFMNAPTSGRDQFQRRSNLILIAMTTKTGDVGDTGPLDLGRQPEQTDSGVGQKPSPRDEAARSMIGIGIHVMPSYLAQDQTATTTESSQ